MLQEKEEKKLLILDFIGSIIGIVAIGVLMLALIQASSYFFIIFSILFIYVFFQCVEFVCSLVKYRKKIKIKKYSGCEVRGLKNKFTIL